MPVVLKRAGAATQYSQIWPSCTIGVPRPLAKATLCELACSWKARSRGQE